jgi:hypothetical protein
LGLNEWGIILITKKTKGLSIFTLSVCLVLSLTACTVNVGVPNGSGSSTQTQNESALSSSAIDEYLNQINSLVGQESELLGRYGSVTGENYTDDLTMFNTLVELLPDVQKFIAEIETITPSDSNLAAIHQKFIDGWNLQAKGMTLATAALQEQDFGKMAEANEALAEGRSLLASFAKELESLN